jgi:hypothetical protein
MSENINKRFKDLQPYVLSMRFNKGLTVIDTMFKEGWEVPDSNTIGFETMENKPNYYMLYPLTDNHGIDDILDYVDFIIKVNIEREMKYELLVSKINELEELFKKNDLNKCKTLNFTFSDIKKSINGKMSINSIPLNITPKPDSIDHSVVSEIKNGEPPSPEVLDRETSDDIEKWNSMTQNEEVSIKVGNETIDLPVRNNKIELQDFVIPQVVCKCDPNDPSQVCPECYQ